MSGLLRIAESLVLAWTSGMHDEVFIYICREPPIRAACLTTMVLGLLTEQEGQPDGMEFLTELTNRAEKTRPST